MRVVFDLMGTVLGSFDYSLRPGIREAIDRLRASGVKVDFWTGGPLSSYTAILREAGLNGDVYSKLKGLPFTPDLCVDDEPEDWMPAKVYAVKPHVSEDIPGDSISAMDLLMIGGTERSVFAN